MGKVTKDEMIFLGNEMFEVMELDTDVPKDGTIEDLLDYLKIAADEILPDDRFSDEAIDIMDKLGFTDALKILGIPVSSPQIDEAKVIEENNQKEQIAEEDEPQVEKEPEPATEESLVEDDESESESETEDEEPKPKPEPEKSKPVKAKHKPKLVKTQGVHNIDIDQLLDAMELRKKQRGRAPASSPVFSKSIEIICRNPDLERKEFFKIVEKELNISFDDDFNSKRKASSVYSQVRRIIGLLHKYGHMPGSANITKPTTSR